MKIRLIALLAVVALAVMAVPASADPGVGVIQGNAAIEVVTPAGQAGLGFPVLHSGVTGTWHLTGNITGTTSGPLDVKGKLGPNAAGVGASCGMSSGSDGTGSFAGHSTTDTGWITSAGGTIAATGTYSGHGSGSYVAIVQAYGGALECANAAANNFTVVGVLAAA